MLPDQTHARRCPCVNCRAERTRVDSELQRRHHAALRVVTQLADEDDRLLLLDYVVHGSERVDEALRAKAYA